MSSARTRYRLSVPGPESPCRMQHFSHMPMAHAAARHHQGIALTNDYMMQPDDAPDLMPLYAGMQRKDDSSYFACRTGPRAEPALRSLRQWLLRQAVASGLPR